MKPLLFIFLGSALIYFSIYGKSGLVMLPTRSEMDAHYAEVKFEKKYLILEKKFKELEFKYTRLTQSEHSARSETSVADNSHGKSKLFNYTEYPEEDVVVFDVYQWSADKLHSITLKEYQNKNYVKAAQYGMTLLNEYSRDALVTDSFYLMVGMSALESKVYLPESAHIFSTMVDLYPRSSKLVKAKLWLSIAYYRSGRKDHFNELMDEFNAKYRNTQEWNIVQNLFERSIASEVGPKVLKDSHNKTEDHE
jgi:TolA-binding protein